jgi:DNA replication protein DnaC
METTKDDQILLEQLGYLKLPFFRDNYESFAKKAAEKQWDHIHFLSELTIAEVNLRRDGATQRRIRKARFPQVKTLDAFKWGWPKKINRLQVQNAFRLNFIDNKSNIVFISGVGLGKTHLAIALGYQACLKGHNVLFSSAVDAVNTLLVAKNTGQLKPQLKKYEKPSLLILDELGYLPIDKAGADLLFQIISKRYENGSIIITTNRVFKNWPEIFNNDPTLTSALLDRLLHHTETIMIEGQSYRMKDTIES